MKHKSPSTRELAAGDRVVVTPPTTARARDMEAYLGEVAGPPSDGKVKVRRLVGKKTVKAMPIEWVRYQKTFESSPLWSRPRFRNMTGNDKAQVKASAAEKVKASLYPSSLSTTPY